MKYYKVGIYTPNKVFLVKGRVVRSPFEAKISEKELEHFKMKIKSDGIDSYTIEEFKEDTIIGEQITNIKPSKDIPITENYEIKIEELEQKSKSILDKFIDGET